jgi:hypothetical protein
MSNNKISQRARSEAIREVLDAHPEEFKAAMERAADKHGIAWSPRLTAQERAERDRVEREAKALERIQKIAKENGLAEEKVALALGVAVVTEIKPYGDAAHVAYSGPGAHAGVY